MGPLGAPWDSSWLHGAPGSPRGTREPCTPPKAPKGPKGCRPWRCAVAFKGLLHWSWISKVSGSNIGANALLQSTPENR